METPTDRPRNPGRVVELVVADEPAAWAAAGFTVTGDRVRIGPVALHLSGRTADGPRGITGWVVTGLHIDGDLLDGLPTRSVPDGDGEPNPSGGVADHGAPDDQPAHPNGVVGLDHIVVATPDLDRTIAACTAAGLELRRIRDTEVNGSPMRQAFFKLGPVVLEVVSGDLGVGLPTAEAPASFFGLAVDVADLDETAAALGDGLGRIKPAVQRGRRIATLRHRHFGLSVAVAVMDDHLDRTAPEPGR